nr:hypothetical protein [uncultured Oscillibacter sp.]
MAIMQNQYSPQSAASGAGARRADTVDWSQEITPARPAGGAVSSTANPQLDMKNDLPTEVIDAPTTVAEAEAGSWKAMLSRNMGNYVVATFLIGTQGTVSWEGILYDVGNNYLTIYQAGRDRYIVCDIYSLKYIEFYDTSRRRMCDEILRQQGWPPNG